MYWALMGENVKSSYTLVTAETFQGSFHHKFTVKGRTYQHVFQGVVYEWLIQPQRWSFWDWQNHCHKMHNLGQGGQPVTSVKTGEGTGNIMADRVGNGKQCSWLVRLVPIWGIISVSPQALCFLHKLVVFPHTFLPPSHCHSEISLPNRSAFPSPES